MLIRFPQPNISEVLTLHRKSCAYNELIKFRQIVLFKKGKEAIIETRGKEKLCKIDSVLNILKAF